MCIILNSVSQNLDITRSGVDKVKFVENVELHQNVIFLLNHKMNENDQASYLWFWTWIWTRAVQFSYSTVHNRSVFTLELQSSIDVRCRKPAFASKASRT